MWTSTTGVSMKISSFRSELYKNEIITILFTFKILNQMKKLFLISMAATALLASCSNDETVEMAQQKAIGFSNAFVNNSTRSINDPSYVNGTDATKNLLKDFVVYGYVNEGVLFGSENEKVYREYTQKDDEETPTGNWKYDNTKYWVPGNSYTFGAIAPHSMATNVSNVALVGEKKDKVGMEVSFTNSNEKQIDLLHAAPAKIEGTTVDANYSTAVALTFYHQLSKVKFSFLNSVGTGYNVKVENIKITDAYTSGKLTVGATENSWSDQATKTLALDFGNAVAADATSTEAGVIANNAEYESYYEKLMIPMAGTVGDAAITYNVTFDVYLYLGNECLNEKVTEGETTTYKPYKKTATISGVEFKLGYCYDFKATLTAQNVADNEMNPITFTVSSISDWTAETEGSITVGNETATE